MLGRGGIKYIPDGQCPTRKINKYCMDHPQIADEGLCKLGLIICLKNWSTSSIYVS